MNPGQSLHFHGLGCFINFGIIWTLYSCCDDQKVEGLALPRMEKEEVYPLDMTDRYTVLQLAQIVQSLENLDLLESSHSTCYKLDQVFKVQKNAIQSEEETGAWIINVSFTVRETMSSPHNKDSGALTPEPSLVSEQCFVKISGFENGSNPEWKGTENMTETNTSAGYDGQTGGEHMDTLDETSKNLSRTQIMVISTCSTVIGLFFMVALIMRIRNYLARIKKDQANRKKFRSSSLYLSGPPSRQGEDDGNPNSPHNYHLNYPSGNHGYRMDTDPGGFSLFLDL